LIGLKVSLEVYLCAIAESFCSCGIFRADTPFDFAQGSELAELQVCPYCKKNPLLNLLIFISFFNMFSNADSKDTPGRIQTGEK